MSKKVHYHPLTILLHILSALKAWIPFIVIGIIRNGFKDGWETLLIFGGAAMLLSMWACVKYFFESYTIDADKLVIYEGIIRKKEIEVTYERMQAIKQRQWFFLVPFHVVSLQIETAGGESKPEVNIPAIPIRVFNEIEHYRQHANDKQEKNFPEQQADEAVIEKSPLYEEQAVKYQLTNRQIFLFGITDLSVFMGIFVVLLTIERFMSKEWVDEVADVTISAVQTGGLFVVAFGILFMVVAMLFAMIKSMITYYHFKVSYFEKTLTIERGLLEKHVQKIPLNKVQGIRIKQN
ncbi:PH domain-containing protein, partial [Enterococcus durans]